MSSLNSSNLSDSSSPRFAKPNPSTPTSSLPPSAKKGEMSQKAEASEHPVHPYTSLAKNPKEFEKHMLDEMRKDMSFPVKSAKIYELIRRNVPSSFDNFSNFIDAHLPEIDEIIENFGWEKLKQVKTPKEICSPRNSSTRSLSRGSSLRRISSKSPSLRSLHSRSSSDRSLNTQSPTNPNLNTRRLSSKSSTKRNFYSDPPTLNLDFESSTNDLISPSSMISPSSSNSRLVSPSSSSGDFEPSLSLESPRGSLSMESLGSGPSLEDFRSTMIKEINKLTVATLRAMGYGGHIEHKAIGTEGFDSDIDSCMIAEVEMSQEVQTMEKFLFDILCFQVFGGIPGKMLDAERYVPSLAKTINTGSRLSTEMGREGFGYLEEFAAELQMYQRFRQHPDQWEKHKKEQLEGIAEFKRKNIPSESMDSYEKALILIFQDIEELEKDIENGIAQHLEKGPHSSPSEIRKMAEMSYKIPKLMQLSAHMEILRQLIKSREKSLIKHSSNSKEVEKLHKEIDLLELEIGICGMLRDRFCDESYFTQGAVEDICLVGNASQATQTEIKTTLKLVNQQYAKGEIPAVTPYSLVPQSGSGPKPKHEALMVSQLENQYMYAGHFQQKKEELEADSRRNGFPVDNLANSKIALVSASKYAERVTSATRNQLDEIESVLRKSPSSIKRDLILMELVDLQDKCKELHRQTKSLERCKRKQLSDEATRQLLLDELGNDETTKALINKIIRIEEDVKFKEGVHPKEIINLIYCQLMQGGYYSSEMQIQDIKEQPITSIEGVKPYIIDLLIQGGFDKIGKLLSANTEVLSKIIGEAPGISKDMAQEMAKEIIEQAKKQTGPEMWILKGKGKDGKELTEKQCQKIQAIIQARCGPVAFNTPQSVATLVKGVLGDAQARTLRSFQTEKEITAFNEELATLSMQAKLLSIEVSKQSKSASIEADLTPVPSIDRNRLAIPRIWKKLKDPKADKSSCVIS